MTLEGEYLEEPGAQQPNPEHHGPDKFEAAADAAKAADGAQPGGGDSTAQPEGQVLPNFEKIAERIVTTPWKIAAVLFKDKNIELEPWQVDALTAMAIPAIEELYPAYMQLLQKLFGNTKFPATCALFAAAGLVGLPQLMTICQKIQESRQPKQTASRTGSTTTADSPASSGT